MVSEKQELLVEEIYTKLQIAVADWRCPDELDYKLWEVAEELAELNTPVDKP